MEQVSRRITSCHLHRALQQIQFPFLSRFFDSSEDLEVLLIQMLIFFFLVFQWENRFRDWFSKIWHWMHWPLDFHCKNSFIDVNFGKNIIENGQKNVLLLFKNIYTLTVLFPYMLLIIPFVYWQPLKKSY